MKKISKSKPTAILLIFSFIFLYSIYDLRAQGVSKGNLMGSIYDEGGTTPIEGAVVKLRNISTGEGYESSESDNSGFFKLKDIDEGLYIIGISTREGDFNVPNLVGIKANKTANVTFNLTLTREGQQGNTRAKQGGLAKFFLSPIGIAIIAGASAAIFYGIVKLTEKEAEVSPFKR